MNDRYVGYIYGLVDPRTNVVAYVGQTTNLKGRFHTHLRRDSEATISMQEWKDSLGEASMEPTTCVLETIEGNSPEELGEALSEAESKHINEQLLRGGAFVNSRTNITHVVQRRSLGVDRDDEAFLYLRLPAALKTSIEEAARRDDRTVSSWVRVTLERAMCESDRGQ